MADCHILNETCHPVSSLLWKLDGVLPQPLTPNGRLLHFEWNLSPSQQFTMETWWQIAAASNPEWSQTHWGRSFSPMMLWSLEVSTRVSTTPNWSWERNTDAISPNSCSAWAFVSTAFMGQRSEIRKMVEIEKKMREYWEEGEIIMCRVRSNHCQKFTLICLFLSLEIWKFRTIVCFNNLNLKSSQKSSS